MWIRMCGNTGRYVDKTAVIVATLVYLWEQISIHPSWAPTVVHTWVHEDVPCLRPSPEGQQPVCFLFHMLCVLSGPRTRARLHAHNSHTPLICHISQSGAFSHNMLKRERHLPQRLPTSGWFFWWLSLPVRMMKWPRFPHHELVQQLKSWDVQSI